MRRQIAMSTDEVEVFLGSQHLMRLATLKASGAPHIVSMWFGMLDGRIVFSSYAKSQKVVNLRRDPRVACQIEEGDHPSEVRGVCIDGVATVVEGRAAVADIIRAVSRQALGADPTAASLEAMGAAKRVGVTIEIGRVASWDHTKVPGGYMRGRIPGEAGPASRIGGSTTLGDVVT